jgi:hypothetical protein
MSITSANEQQINSDFSALLARHPGIEIWLSEIVQHADESQAEMILPSFLTECANQDVPGNSYPFTALDQGLAGLRAYIHRTQEEIRTIAERSTSLEEQDTAQMSPVPPEIAATSLSGQEIFKEDKAERSISLEEQDTAQMSPVPPEIAATSLSGQEIFKEDKTEKEQAADSPQEAEEVTAKMESAPAAVPSTVPVTTRRQTRGRKRRHRPRRTRRQRIVAWGLVILILAAILVPAGFLVNFGLSAYNIYHNLSNEAHSAVGHLLNVEKIFTGTGSQSHLGEILDVARLQQAQKEFVASGQNFQQIQNELKHSSTLNTVVAYFPTYRTTLKSAQVASAIGIDIAQIGQIATERGMQLVSTLKGPLLATSNQPLVTQSMFDTIGVMLDQVLPLLNDIQANAQNLSLSALPISAQEKAQIEPLLQQLPRIINDLSSARDLLGIAGWVLGVDQPRTFLVQTMDRAELRGAGGFTGQYGELTINAGRVAPFSLKDISSVEYTTASANYGQFAPEQYRSWWPFANWGLRDSNISADFPTTAQLAIDLYKQEVGDQVDGVISFTPVLIEHVLAIIGPIQVPSYNVTVTAQNLEDLLHYYQLDNKGIGQQKVNQPGDNATTTRKRFTNYLATLFMQKIRAASPAELLSIIDEVLYDLKTRDLQIYFANPAAQAVLVQYGYAGQLDRSATHDGLYVVQQNLSASKASQYVQTTIHDTVTLDSKGGATHLLQLRLVYNQAGPVYGYDAYYDYLRVYVPPNSQLISGDGFSTGTPLCGGPYGDCPVNGVYPGGELICPAGQYQPGAFAPSLSGSNGASWQPLQTIGGPTNTISDEPGRAMYAGWVIVPKNCTMNVTLSWYVPPLSQQPYSLLVQRQAGTFPELDLTILPSAANCIQLRATGLHFDKILTQDTSFTIPTYDPTKRGAQTCYPQPPV